MIESNRQHRQKIEMIDFQIQIERKKKEFSSGVFVFFFFWGNR